jgi:hypothetical protein
MKYTSILISLTHNCLPVVKHEDGRDDQVIRLDVDSSLRNVFAADGLPVGDITRQSFASVAGGILMQQKE